MRIENIREDTDISYDELNFLYKDLESIIMTIDTRENMTYRVQVKQFSSQFSTYFNFLFK